MRPRIARCAAIFGLAMTMFAACWQASAAGAAPATIETPHRDPWVPPAQRVPSLAAPTQGAQLRAQVESNLAATFAAADKRGTGVLTRAEARAAGLGFIDKHFDEIDARRSGVVRFDDVKRYLDEQRRPLRAPSRPADGSLRQ
ncbi:MAG: EF-hand domain-containing protein [Casimicrobiaceae bacterium]